MNLKTPYRNCPIRWRGSAKVQPLSGDWRRKLSKCDWGNPIIERDAHYLIWRKAHRNRSRWIFSARIQRIMLKFI